MTSKQAWEIVKNGIIGHTEKEFYEAVNIIEKDLELLEKIKEEYKKGRRIHYYESEQ